MQRKSAMGRPSASVTVASQSCVVRPPWTSLASHAIVPSCALRTKFVFSSIVVKPVAPSGRDSMQPYPQGAVGERDDRPGVDIAVRREEGGPQWQPGEDVRGLERLEFDPEQSGQVRAVAGVESHGRDPTLAAWPRS